MVRRIILLVALVTANLALVASRAEAQPEPVWRWCELRCVGGVCRAGCAIAPIPWVVCVNGDGCADYCDNCTP